MSAVEPAARSSGLPHVTVWYDGACPLCTREIALFRRLDGAGRIAFVDVADPDAAPSCPLDRGSLLARFHAQERGRPIVSGAAAFAALWRATPVLAWLGHLARLPPVLWALERLYVAFLRVRPRMQAWFTAKTHS
jgi:predicted DCC family thiol-disulfide oxidoreductase YuxK